MKSSIIACLACLFCFLFAADLRAADEKTWSGRWTNRRFKTSGPLKCVASETSPGTWKATFSGTFQGDPFSYDVTFQSKGNKTQPALSGTAKISGQDYQWTGSLKGKQLTGEYKATNGYNGTFVLTEAK